MCGAGMKGIGNTLTTLTHTTYAGFGDLIA